jgi:hypothetical protein
MLDTGYWILDTGCWILDAGYWMLDAGYWMLNAGCWVPDAGYWMQAGLHDCMTARLQNCIMLDYGNRTDKAMPCLYNVLLHSSSHLS